MAQIQVTMKAGDLRKLRPRHVVMSSVNLLPDLEDFDLVIGDHQSYRINRCTGETFTTKTSDLYGGVDWSKELEGVPDNTNVQVSLNLYHIYLGVQKMLEAVNE